jgi:hypothetical protein
VDLTAIRKGLADRAATVVGTAHHFEPGSINGFPTAFVEMPDGETIAMGQSSWSIELAVVVAVADVWDRSAQESVDRLVTDLWPVLEADHTLGGAVAGSVTVQSFQAIRPQDNLPWIGARFLVRVVHTDA